MATYARFLDLMAVRKGQLGAGLASLFWARSSPRRSFSVVPDFSRALRPDLDGHHRSGADRGDHPHSSGEALTAKERQE